jgi:hypothetical protein
VCTVFGVSRLFPGSIFGFKAAAEALNPDKVLLQPSSTWQGALGIVLGLVAFAGLVLLNPETKPAKPEAAAPHAANLDSSQSRAAAHGSLMTAAAVLAGTLLMLLVGRDLALTENPGTAPGALAVAQPGAIRLLQLFSYNYTRAWPVDSINFAAILMAFVLVALGLYLLLIVARTRKAAILTFFAFTLVTALWGIDVYMVKLAPHWGQRELFEAYYKMRTGPEEQIVAYQMNWKGENFYASNHIPEFGVTGAPGSPTAWLKTQREKGVKVVYFITEHSRVNGLRNEVGGKEVKEMTDKRTNNKFLLVRAEL